MFARHFGYQMGLGGEFGERAPDIYAWEAACKAPSCAVPVPSGRFPRRPLADRSALRRRDAAGFCRARFRRRRQRGDRRQAESAVRRRGAALRSSQRRQSSGQARAVWPLLRSVPALPPRRSGCGLRPAGAPGPAWPARQRGACDPRASRPRRRSRLSRPAKSGSGAPSRSLTVIRRAPRRARISFDSRSPFHVSPPYPPGPRARLGVRQTNRLADLGPCSPGAR